MSDNILYKDRDIEQLDEDGGFYCKHMSHMTSEGLHSKSDIAAELAYRDSIIYQLTTDNKQLSDALESSVNFIHKANNDIEILQMQIELHEREQEILYIKTIEKCIKVLEQLREETHNSPSRKNGLFDGIASIKKLKDNYVY